MRPVSRPLPAPAAVAAGAAGLVALFGTYWDDAWHTDRGRDDFFIAPHVTLYAGVALTGLVTAAWLLRAYLAAGGGVRGARTVLRAPAVLLALSGASATLASAPVDNAWHQLYGRDAVLWSPPHMLGVAGSAAMSIGLLAGTIGTAGRLAATGRVLLGVGVLGSLLVPVLEFDSDVPQFPAWTYWPATTAGVLLAALVLRDLLHGRWAVTVVAAAYTAAKAAVGIALGVLDHSGTLVAPVVVVAVADDLLHRRGATALVRGLAVALLVPPSWQAAVALQPGQATSVPADQAVLGAVACVAAALVVLVATGRLRPPRPRTARPAVVALGLLAAVTLDVTAMPQAAWAHDPGQGRLAGHVRYDVTREGQTVSVTADVGPERHSCDQMRPVELVARRAGEQVRGPLALAGCVATATLELPAQGRWFLYAVLDDTAEDHQTAEVLESWTPLAAGASRVREIRDLYVSRPDSETGATPAQVGSGVVLYAVVLALLVTAGRLARRAGQDLSRPRRLAWRTRPSTKGQGP